MSSNLAKLIASELNRHRDNQRDWSIQPRPGDGWEIIDAYLAPLVEAAQRVLVAEDAAADCPCSDHYKDKDAALDNLRAELREVGGGA